MKNTMKNVMIFDPVTKQEFPVDNKAESHGNRAVDFTKIHGVTQADLDKLICSLSLQEGDNVVDIGCGYGDASLHALLKQPKIKLYPLDVSDLQLSRIKKNISIQITNHAKHILDVLQGINYTKGSGTHLPFENSSIDKIIQKMSLHEMTKTEQQVALKEAYRVLKKGGKISIWDIFLIDEDIQILFQDIVRKKDELAGFQTQVEKRYFFREDEFQNYVINAGFDRIEEVCKVSSRFGTRIRVDEEFQGDEIKLMNWHEYIRERMKEVSLEVKTKIRYEDQGDNIEFDILQKKVFCLTK